MCPWMFVYYHYGYVRIPNLYNKRTGSDERDGRSLEGRLVGFDEYMNMVLEDTMESGAEGSDGRRLGKVVLRGSNVVSIAIL